MIALTINVKKLKRRDMLWNRSSRLGSKQPYRRYKQARTIIKMEAWRNFQNNYHKKERAIKAVLVI